MKKKKKRIRIKPYSDELSFAFNPKTGKKFFMRKDDSMPGLIEILQDEKVSILKKDEVLQLLQNERISEDGINAIEGVLKILLMNKDELPKGLLTKIAKSVPEYSTFADPCDVADVETLRSDIRKEILEEMKKDGKNFETLQAQMIQLQQDLKASSEELKSAKVEIAKAQDEREFVKIRQDLQNACAVGDLDETAHMIQAVSKIDKDLADNLMKQQKDVANIAQAIGIDDNLGRSGGGEPSSAFDKLNKMVQDKMAADSSLLPNKAWRMIKDENPALFKQYLKSRKGHTPIGD
jgi:hypothetical protein